MVYYRKYRPQKIEELDLDSVRGKLSSILSSASVPHAFLFTGPKGLGKTSSARILAKAINCEKREKKKIEPCNSCEACISITQGSNIDVLEIDAASNRGIDEIRELRERIKFAPAALSKKVYIIDEVHMLTTEAFNALLKTLEEPPDHVVFILCTTEREKLPGTIVSRAFHVQFEKPTTQQIANSLSRIVKGESLEIEEGVLEKVASLSDGAFRDAAKILEELVLAAGDKKVSLELVESVYKLGGLDQEVKKLLQALAAKNAKEALGVIDSLAQNGADFKTVIERIVEELRKQLLAQTGLLTAGNEGFDVGSIETLLEYFNQAYKDIKLSVLPQLPLELLVVKYCVIDQAESGKWKVESLEEKDEKISKSSEPEAKQKSSAPAVSVNGSNSDFLKQLIERVKKDNFAVAGVLRSFSLGGLDESSVELVTPYKFHGEKLQDAKALKILEQRSAEILGRNVKVVIIISK